MAVPNALPEPRPTLPPPFLVGGVRVEPSLNRLHAGSGAVHVEPRVMQLLVRLARTPGEVVVREALIEAVWGGAFASDEGLTQAVSRLRRALGDGRMVETVPKVGYRLVAPVSTALPPTGDGQAGAPPTLTLAGPAQGEARDSPRPSRRTLGWAVAGALALVAGTGAWVAGVGREAPTRVEIRQRVPLDARAPAARPLTLAVPPEGADVRVRVRRVARPRS